MDLSKIPEPSEGDLDNVRWLLTLPQFCMKERVIAHLLRHGSVLAKNIDLEMVDSEQLGEVMVAIEFFEKFGGNNER